METNELYDKAILQVFLSNREHIINQYEKTKLNSDESDKTQTLIRLFWSTRPYLENDSDPIVV